MFLSRYGSYATCRCFHFFFFFLYPLLGASWELLIKDSSPSTALGLDYIVPHLNKSIAKCVQSDVNTKPKKKVNWWLTTTNWKAPFVSFQTHGGQCGSDPNLKHSALLCCTKTQEHRSPNESCLNWAATAIPFQTI